MALAMLGALLAGFTTGLAGFGTGLIAAGLWLHVLPAESVPPLVALISISAHAVSLRKSYAQFDWRCARPFLIAGVLGLPVGLWLLSVASADSLRLAMGCLLVMFVAVSWFWPMPEAVSEPAPSPGDYAAGGILGGFAGLSGPVPLIWLERRGFRPKRQRSIYQPFNFVILILASTGMLLAGHIDTRVALIWLLCLPAALLGARIGVAMFGRLDDGRFRQIVLIMLMASGALLVWSEVARPV